MSTEVLCIVEYCTQSVITINSVSGICLVCTHAMIFECKLDVPIGVKYTLYWLK